MNRESYAVGDIIRLHTDSLDNAPRTIQAKIIQLHQPFTLSCVATVEINANDLDITDSAIGPAKAILKLYDRRFASQLRKDEKCEPWTEATEDAYVSTVRSGEAAEFVRRLNDESIDFREPEEGWSTAENEAYLQNMCSDYFSDETKAYDVMKSLQGKQIPRLYSAVSLPLERRNFGESFDQDTDLLCIPGILLEYIPGPTLSTMTDVIPRQSWQGIVEQAVQNVRAYSSLGFLNRDVRPSNFVVNEQVPDGHERRVVMIDFAVCEFREDDQSDDEWGRMKWSEDEENAVGCVMQMKLERVGFDLEYERSSPWHMYAMGEDDEY